MYVYHYIYMKKLYKSSKGFTLIELLIVIAVLGILAAVVLVAINPLEQLARGRDSGRLSDVAQLGHAVQAYYTAQSGLLSTAPAGANFSTGWQNVLVYSQDIKNTITAPTQNSNCGGTMAGTAAQGTFCYSENGTSNFLVWTDAESNQSFTKAKCTTGQTAVFVYDSTQGKAGVGCIASATTAPAAGITLY